MQSNAILRIFIYLICNQIFTQAIPMSPCPKIFQYRFDGTDWFGLLSVRNPNVGQQLNLRITLSLRGKPTTNYLGEIELLTRGQQKKNTPILYKVKFPKTHLSPPKLQQITINQHIVCLGAAEQGMFVTQIQLEHIRKFSFVPEGLQVPFGTATSSIQNGGGDQGNIESDSDLQEPSTDDDSNMGLGTKHLPLSSNLDKPIRTSKDICGTIDNRIRYQVLHASRAQKRNAENGKKNYNEPISRKDIFFGKLFEENRQKINDASSHNKDNVGRDNKDNAVNIDVDDGANLPLVTGDESDYDDDMDDDDDDNVDDTNSDSSAFLSSSPSPKGGRKSTEEIPTITRGAWPWLAAIYVNNLTSLAYQCGGTLISTRIVISSAHCFKMFQKMYSANEVLVFLGRHNLKNWNEEGSIAAPVDDIFIHPDYDSHLNSYDADIAVLVLKNEVRLSTFIRPACLWSGPNSVQYIEGEHGVVVGWSRNTYFNITNAASTSPSPSQLPSPPSPTMINTVPRVINAPIVSNEVCFESNDKFRSLSSNRTFCAGIVERNDEIPAKESNANLSNKRKFPRGPCTGDSGAGLMIYKNNRWFLRGIVSASLPVQHSSKAATSTTTKWKGSNCNDNQYVIYTDAAKFLDWIFAFII